MVRIGICGYGYWGPNLARSFHSNSAFRLTAIAECRLERQTKAQHVYNGICTFDNAEELIDSGEVDAVAIVTPSSSHYPLAARALRRGIHVLVEKPMATSIDEAEELVKIAAAHNAKLLVDHIYIFHDALIKLKELKMDGALGDISYYDSLRVNLGLFQPDMNVLWDLGPHDFSIVDYLFEQAPFAIEATGYCHVNPNLPDIVYVTAHYPSRMIAHFNLSWMSPVKARRIAVGGNEKMVVWDDLNLDERLKIYASGVEFQSEDQRSAIIPNYRIGDVYSPRLSNDEPLTKLASHFAQVITSNAPSPVDGMAGLRVVKMLEDSQKALDASLRSRQLSITELNDDPGKIFMVRQRRI